MERLLAALDDWGNAEDTLVIFASDHGELIGSYVEYYKGEAVWEEPIHVPLLARYPARLPRGEIRTGPTSLIDLMPTVLSLCDAEIPDDFQGEDVTGVLRDRGSIEREGVYFEHSMGRDSEWRALRIEDHLLAVDHDRASLSL